MAHIINIRQETLRIPQGDHTEEYRATCACGWTEKSISSKKVQELADKHARAPHRS